MTRHIFMAALLAGAAASAGIATAATTDFYVAQDAKTHACSVTSTKPDGTMAMDVGTKAYDSEANAKKAMDKLKVCASSAMAAPAGFYVAQDAKTKKCSVVNAKPDGKMAMDVGTKKYDSEANATKAMANLKACK